MSDTYRLIKKFVIEEVALAEIGNREETIPAGFIRTSRLVQNFGYL